MKFLNDTDKKLYELELSSQKLNESDFIKNRSVLIKRLKDFRKKQNTKDQWRHNRFQMLKGIKKFHKSTKGKRFHRRLGNFLALRPLRKVGESEYKELILPLSSMLTYTHLKNEYYEPQLTEQVDNDLFADAVSEQIVSILQKIQVEEVDFSDFEDFLFAIVETASLIKSFAELTGKTEKEVEKLWKKAKKIVEQQYNKTEKDVDFFKLVVGVLKKSLKIKNGKNK